MATRFRYVLVAALGCAVGCSGADAVFVESRVSQAEKAARDQVAELKTEISALKAQLKEQTDEQAQKLSIVAANVTQGRMETDTKLLIADEVQAKKLIVLASDEPDCARIILGRVKDSMCVLIFRDTKTPMLSLSVATDAGDGELVMFDKTLIPRLKVRVQGNGDAALMIADDKQKPRLGMMSTHEGEAEFLRFDKFGNLKSLK